MVLKKIDLSTKKVNRICFLNPQGYVQMPPPLGKTDTGGQTIYVLQLAEALGKKNIKVDIITRQFDGQPQEEQVSPNVRIVRIPAGGSEFVAKEKMYELMPEWVENFMQYIEKTRKRYDLIHTHYWDGGYAGVLLKRMLDIPHVHTPHTLGKAKKMELAIEETPVQKLKPSYRYHVRIAIEQRIINDADAVIVLCETTRIQILHYYMADFEKLHVIFPGIDTSYFSTKASAVDKKLKFEPNSILTMSRVVPAKGLDRLIDALALLKNKIPFHVYMGGDITQGTISNEEKNARTQIELLIKKYHMEKYVTFLGQTNHNEFLPAYYRKADIFCLPARYEPFGLTTLEAMACGTVPLVSSVAGSREVIIDGLNGFIINSHDRKQLAEQVFNLLKNKTLLKKVSENASFTIKEHYTWDKIVDKFITLYKRLI